MNAVMNTMHILDKELAVYNLNTSDFENESSLQSLQGTTLKTLDRGRFSKGLISHDDELKNFADNYLPVFRDMIEMTSPHHALFQKGILIPIKKAKDLITSTINLPLDNLETTLAIFENGLSYIPQGEVSKNRFPESANKQVSKLIISINNYLRGKGFNTVLLKVKNRNGEVIASIHLPEAYYLKVAEFTVTEVGVFLLREISGVTLDLKSSASVTQIFFPWGKEELISLAKEKQQIAKELLPFFLYHVKYLSGAHNENKKYINKIINDKTLIDYMHSIKTN